ncbi:hypothetical protein JQU17_20060 [Ponticoccus sp. SC2-23]|uniref:PHP domain-containing protein n=1 Tax=Alexandriicola marinus TaxID=2081710 RepID=UPI000FD8512C|nr:hypothetical protein [Alexandriicola marinus]MBM1222510.1 hypothetical protein [Ponticoccus sp. SC6-9]MBM1227016.1 hypothetical protein [Ponticoccus sp. SC6-15]MBM1231437.1 hypothetical protein [Ponticoccus sp. SC6-38]MBM1236010.1 hypothetical protein [Ponticoccus sp. SC6-45]MBM1240460.1 hypothetical protein [Ponticoccus sp. SC6-49]MBM1244995.1 hypothetical protein [Ponticoccus sp. SC2-64]MBM1249484.1 hypothetical protein [Ponticoccus sp. SC6-42]MBM1253953.1 hypothetical protein [Pontico
MTSIRIVLHAHSLWSYDGHWTLDRIARFYGAFGVRAVMLTEHDTGFDPQAFGAYREACVAASTVQCRLIPGIEYSCPDNDIHILTWGLDRFLGEHRNVIDTLRDVQSAGGVSIFAHPVRRSAFAAFEDAWVPYLHGIELWNRKSDGLVWGAEAFELIHRTGLPATVGQDLHKLRHAYPLSHHAEIDVPPTDKSAFEAALVAAIRSGRTRPYALGAPLLKPNGHPRAAPHRKFEMLRRSLKALQRK